MPLYPLSALIALLGCFTFWWPADGNTLAPDHSAGGGIAAYLWRARGTGEWPFAPEEARSERLTVAGDIFVDLILGGSRPGLSRARKFLPEIIAAEVGGGAAITACGCHGWDRRLPC